MSIDILINESNLKHGAIEFDKVKEENFIPAIERAMEIAKKRLSVIKNNSEEPGFENVIEDLELAGAELDRVLGIFYNLHSAEATDKLQELAGQVSAMSANFSSDLLLDSKLFTKVKHVYDSENQGKLSPEQKMLLEKNYKGFVRNGALLNEDQKNQLKKLDEDLSKLAPQYSENLLKETNSFEMLIESKSDLAGLPDMVVEAAREAAVESGIKRANAWLITLDAPILVPFLQFAENRELRKKLWTAYQSRCVSGETSNLEVIKSIVCLRHKRARLLGFDNHAEYVLQERMAKNPKTVSSFLKDLESASIEAAKKDLKEAQEFAEDAGLKDTLAPWDFSFYSNKLRTQKFSFDPELLRPYFPVDKCIAGAFDLAEKLFGVRFEKNTDIPTYHKDVVAYEVFSTKADEFVGLFYADFYPRATKRGGAWMTSYKSQGWSGSKVDRPHVSIVCNFTKPAKKKPSLLSFSELETLFHEFGHSLHGLLSQCRYKSLGGTNVFWDFVELPSQFMENWLLESDVLDMFAAHYKTGEKVPAEYIKKLQAGAKFQSGYRSLRQLNFAILDMAWHGTYTDDIEDVVEFEKLHTSETNLFPYQEGTCNSASFAHIFAGGYSAGYYSYKWAEVLDADAFAYFKEKGLFDPEVAKSFKENILEKGGSIEPGLLYRAFRGKDPDPKSLLKRDGLN